MRILLIVGTLLKVVLNWVIRDFDTTGLLRPPKPKPAQKPEYEL
jgi:hypothetical protein